MAIDGLIHVAGGTRIDDFTEPDSRIRVYDPAADSWNVRAGPPLLSRSHTGMGFLDGRIHLFGGTGASARSTDTHVAYVMSEGAWYRYPPLPFEARGVRAGALGDGVLVMEAWWDAHTPPSAAGSRFRATGP